jgi:hypothetical protein
MNLGDKIIVVSGAFKDKTGTLVRLFRADCWEVLLDSAPIKSAKIETKDLQKAL